jgi:hypothetical protein
MITGLLVQVLIVSDEVLQYTKGYRKVKAFRLCTNNNLCPHTDSTFEKPET